MGSRVLPHRLLPPALLLAALSWAPTPLAAQVDVRPGRFEPLRQGDPPALAYEEPFFPGARHELDVPDPEGLLGQPLGSRLSRPEEIVALFQQWAEASPRMELRQHGLTHEGRPLVHAVVSAPENLARLPDILADLAALADPRELGQEQARQVLQRAVPVAWLGYSIHGDELSGSDAALALAHHLVADAGEDTEALLRQLVVVIDPSLNPDGRARIIGMVEQSAGRAPTLDYDALQRGRWPWGRGNHYLFDLNRDWMVGSQPETRARWAMLASYHPQLFVDAHEMGSLDSYLFYPQSQPHNPWLPPRLDHWHHVFGADQAAAFDRQGWPYYTREWADGWGPFYSDAWASLRGAIGILYEQAGTAGFPLLDAQGRVRTYREAVHRQATSSLANLRTLAAHRDGVLSDFLARAREAVAEETAGNERMLVVLPGRHPGRERELASLLLDQGIEVWRSDEHMIVRDVEGTLGERLDELDVPPGALVVPARQPLRASVLSYLSFDVPLPEEALRTEREDLQREGRSNMYDVTAWSLPLLFDLDAAWCAARPVPGRRLQQVEPPAGVLEPAAGGAAVAWIVDGGEDASLTFASHALQRGLVLHVADEPFASGGRRFPRGSLLLRRVENGPALEEELEDLAAVSGVTVHGTASGRSPDDGPDLGGGHFHMLVLPKVGLLGGMPVAPDAFGHVWWMLDAELGLPVSHLEAARLRGVDLRRYNVLIVPPAWGWGPLLASLGDDLSAWVRSGGTLIGLGEGASALLGEELGLSGVVRRSEVLDDLDGWLFAARRERESRDELPLDMQALWRRGPLDAAAAAAAAEPSASEGPDAGEGGEAGADARGAAAAPGLSADPDAARQEAWMARFGPDGAILRGLVDDRHWITAGCGPELPVLVSGAGALLARAPTQVPVRLAPTEALRLSGLLWPEAAQLLGDSAWLTTERVGHGQVILFRDPAFFRAAFRGGGRLLGNAVIYGPGVGADPPVGW